MQSPYPRAELDADTGHVLVVARIMGLNSLELEVLLFSDTTYACKLQTIIPCGGSNPPRVSRRRVQGMPLNRVDLSFYQVLQFIGDLFRWRITGKIFVGLSQIGLTCIMVIRIARAVSPLMPLLIRRNRLTLEMNKVGK